MFLEKNNMGASDTPCDAPIMGVSGVSDAPPPHDALILFFDNLVKKLHILSSSNIDIYPSTLEICINNLLTLFSLDLDHPPTPTPYQRPLHPTKNPICAHYFQQNPTYLFTVNV